MREVSDKKLGERVLEAWTSSNALLSVSVVVLGFFVATLLVFFVGRNPAGMYSAIVQVLTGWDLRRGVWNPRYVGEWLALSMPFVLCGLSMAFAARAGLFNIGAEGQYIAGLCAAQFVAVFFPQWPVAHWLLAVLAGVVAGACWGGIVGLLKARFNVSEVVATIMMNYIAFFLSRIFTQWIPGANTFRTPDFPISARIPGGLLRTLTNGSGLNQGFYLMLLAVLVFWLVMERTRLGFALRATGLNRDAARFSGIKVGASTGGAMAFAGAFAGLAGALVALGAFKYGRVLASQDGYGFDGIAVALVGNSTAPGTLLSGLLFGMLKAAQPLMQGRQIPKEITSIITGLVVVFISLRAGVRLLVEWQQKKAAKRLTGATE